MRAVSGGKQVLLCPACQVERPDWAEGLDRCRACGQTRLSAQLGGVVCDECAPPGTPRIAASTVELLGALLAGDWEHAEAAPERERGQASGIVAAYAQWHLERGLRSLSHVSRETAPQ